MISKIEAGEGGVTTDCTDYTDLKMGRKSGCVNFWTVAWNPRAGRRRRPTVATRTFFASNPCNL